MTDKRQPLRLLVAEDSEDDALLLERELHRGGYRPQMTLVDSSAEMRAALAGDSWDLVIADHNMPGFDSLDALALVRELQPDLPFIVVSGSIGEEIAVDVMKSGANDYVMKNNLARLLPAIERELREAENRRAHAAAEATIRHMAYHDSLTGLINRAEFEHRLHDAVERASHADGEHALLYIDLDQFKLVNDSCGHLAGDELLRRLTRHLRHTVRESDTLARLGGDEFGVLLMNCSLERAEQIARELLDRIREYRFVWEDRQFRVSASLGVVRISGEEDAQTLLSMADMACYAAKDRGRNRVHVYTTSDEELTRRRNELQWIQRLREAMTDGNLILYRQRIAALQGGTPHHELLLRMRDGDTIVGPGVFIPAAERYSLMPEIDRWVIARACRSLAAFHRQGGADRPHGALFINLSATSLSDDELIDFIDRQLAENAVAPGCLGFEITETAAIADFDYARHLIGELRRRGCKVALDDFGTGMSSFAYIKSLDVDFLKIDGSFVRQMLDDPIDATIVEMVHRIARMAGMQTIAEFVESNAIRERLQSLGVDFAQGYAIERPQPLDGVPPVLTSTPA
ncbi:MAG TPA: GGDEF domain-containing response regulator [Gammaproteobacteria bacterium]|nr:GGDEF domain-containing response regulator [Gammaproteobacteria bacterium]